MSGLLMRWLQPLKRVCALGLMAALATPVSAQPVRSNCPPVAQQPSREAIERAQAEARDRGMLWKISKGGHSSYLYGTIHIGTLSWAPPGPTIRSALAEVDTMALEINIGDPATLEQLRQALSPKPSDPPVDAALLKALSDEAAMACLPERALDDQKPALRALTLLLLAARWEGLDANFAQELVLTGVAEARKLPIVALETIDDQMSALLPATEPEARRMIQQALSQLKSGVARRGARRMAEAWAKGDLDDLANHEGWCECVTSEEDRSALRRMNGDRNPAMASRLDRLHSQGKRVFAAVGALHMTGAKALPRLLQQRGFTVERVNFPG
jgi:uncharacterized protein